ncbi:hypothetical protein SAMN05444405_102176 [Bacteroides luti]|uniref:Uncharacterized protein n=1 Tax=Bacteroides luti TaxID=1297750 RepID=A0A1M4UUP0_9BACE|nr:hypothetical protein [Bacteroides luti]SHE60422.1 hypothetical protein SAMN05444405_102176 [Bacteroides luti]
MIVFGVAVLILILGLFSDNIAGVSGMSGINNIFKRDKLTAFDSKSPDYKVETGKYTQSTETVTAAGSEGVTTVDDYIKLAKGKLDAILNNPRPLTQAQMQDLAKWLTIYSLGMQKNGVMAEGTFYGFLKAHNLTSAMAIMPTEGLTKVGDNQFDWSNPNMNFNNIEEGSLFKSLDYVYNSLFPKTK